MSPSLAAFMAASEELAVELGQAPIVSRTDIEGIVAETWTSSARPGIARYRTLRSIAGTWMHADARCEGFLQWQHCRHVDIANERERKLSEATDIVIYNPLAITAALTVADILEGFHAVGEWRYSFRRKGQEIEGLTADGVQDGVRQMARKGEAIRTLECHLDRDDERQAFFVARAGRYAISPDGREILLDTTIRGRRISKFEKKADGTGEYFNEDWYEHGITKASRNAEEALMPEALKQWMIAQARDVTTKPAPPAQRGAARPIQSQRQAPANVNTQTGEVFDAPAPPSPATPQQVTAVNLEQAPAAPDDSDRVQPAKAAGAAPPPPAAVRDRPSASYPGADFNKFWLNVKAAGKTKADVLALLDGNLTELMHKGQQELDDFLLLLVMPMD